MQNFLIFNKIISWFLPSNNAPDNTKLFAASQHNHRRGNKDSITYVSLKSIVLEPVIPMTRRSMFIFSLRTATCERSKSIQLQISGLNELWKSFKEMTGCCLWNYKAEDTWSFSWLRSVPPIKPGPTIPTASVVLERKNLEWTALRALTQSSCFNTTVILYSLQPWAIARTLMFAWIRYNRLISPSINGTPISPNQECKIPLLTHQKVLHWLQEC